MKIETRNGGFQAGELHPSFIKGSANLNGDEVSHLYDIPSCKTCSKSFVKVASGIHRYAT
ncbi:hypothetical protein [Foetidibacter luteolus]|uniref:hypothetical protein n=1 Tax=Foetidibacter luteolus TaxID=2608880 RepID=UPI00129A7711|nr:hypothetical protein [Foetidibacter luteolus]